ncbi:NAD(P)-dependent oxidoreductase [Fodinicola feengrottensis]|uniref:DUF1932 domain-containing protein n=1 Tax=Fodinicola feengrottensis TaxID=435914 RepID=A0ABN2I7S0_9ACTN|nr:NAD(P)-dependent oxidoreductase [Fodinicola feengrottensis]
MTPTIAVLHPGEMGAAVAQIASLNATEILWVRAGRSPATHARAAAAGLSPVETLQEALRADIVLSICPPAAAEAVAIEVAGAGFQGIYLDANAISPQRAKTIAERVAKAGARSIDGAIVGPPPNATRRNRLYLSGEPADVAAIVELFADSHVGTVDLGTEIGASSAMKMAYAGYNKATSALAAVAHALAAQYGVTEHLMTEAARTTTSALSELADLPSIVDRAWRWAPEMLEVAETMRAAGLPDDFGRAAAIVLEHWAADKDNPGISREDFFERLHDDR